MKKPLSLALLVLLSSCSSSPKNTSTSIDQIIDDYFEESLKLYPLNATAIGDHRFDDQLTIPITEAFRKRDLELVNSAYNRVKEIGCEHLTEQQTLSCETFLADLDSQKRLIESDLSDWMPFDQMDSFFADYAELASGSSYVTFDNLKDYENFYKRSEVVPAYFDAMIANMRVGVKKKVTTPRILVRKALKQIDDLLVSDYKKSVFYKPVLSIHEKVSGEEADALKTRYEDLIQNKIYPAYRKLSQYVRNEYLPHSRASSGLLDVPGGKKYYLALVRSHTTTDLLPDTIMQIGLKEVSRIQGEFEQIKSKMKFKGSLRAFFESLRKNPKLHPFKTEEQVMNAYRAIESKVRARVPEYFRLMPKAPFEIREVEKFKAANASEAYQNASPDGSRPGIFWVPIPDAKKYASKSMESLFLHEAIPGHHFQISIQQELDLSRYRRFNGNNAYVEGWGLYAESLGKELGMYTDPYQWIGRLENEMHRAIRLVVDTGIHWKGWSRDRAIRYSMDHEPGDEDGITSEIERYMAIPGQALSYKIGELKLQDLKQKAKRLQGDQFDDRNFHDQILKDGALPLSVLEHKIDRWLGVKAPEAKQ
jgi:uncharacterized protein (DUF885 family)